MSNTLLWIVIAILLIAVAVLAWRLWNSSRQREIASDVTPRSIQDAAGDAHDNSDAAARRRSAAPPPASAGGYRADGTGSGGSPNTQRGVPPAARAGGTQAGASSHETFATTRRRSSRPPPALAGHIPGVSATSSSPSDAQPRSRSASRPPAAAAGGPSRDDDPADPEPASRSPISITVQRTTAADALSRATSWAYQLQDVELAAAERAPFDLIVVDYSRDGSDEEAFTAAEVARLKRGGGRGSRLVYAYVSVGEAESYRYYWQRAWNRKSPVWLIGENPEWHENYYVRFWDPQWQEIIFGGEENYISRIAAAGFDGIYLDRCDVHEEIAEHHRKVVAERDDIEADMVAFVKALSAQVRSRHPGLGLILQNAEGLLAHKDVRSAVDACAKEELLFGLSRAETRNTREEVTESRGALDLMRRDGKAVFAVEYLNAPELRLEAAGALRAMGYVPYMALKNRELATLEVDQPEPAVA